MSLYQNITNGEVREIDDAIHAAWLAAGNPKADAWLKLPEKPDYDPDTQAEPVPVNGAWVTRNLTPEEIGEHKQAAADAAEAQLSTATIRRVLREQVLATTPDDGALAELPELFPAWRPWEPVAAGDLLQHEGKTIRVVQSHTTQPDWNPLELPALYSVLIPTPPGSSYPAWQPWDGNNANLYQIGARVTHGGKYWEATVGNNHWEPGVFGWTEFTP